MPYCRLAKDMFADRGLWEEVDFKVTACSEHGKCISEDKYCQSTGLVV